MDVRSGFHLMFAVLAVVALTSCSDDETTTSGTPPDTTPPAIASVTAIDLNHIDVVFNEDVRRSSAEHRDNYVILEIATPFAAAGETAAPGDTLRVGNASLGSDQRTVTLTTFDFMADAINYEMSVSGVSDGSGNTISGTATRTFVGTNTADTTPPSLVYRNPAPGATGVGIAQPALFQFSEPVDYTSVVGGATWAPTGGGSSVLFHVESENSTTFGLVPDAPLSNGVQYTVTLTGVEDFAANPMPTTSWSFTTTSTADNTPPTVVSTVPSNGATNVNVNTSLSLTFSEAINQATFMPQVFPDPGNGVATWSNGGRTVTFDPDTPLLTNQAYNLSILPGNMEDLAGNKNLQIVNVVFSTGSTLPGGSFAGTIAGDPGTAAADPTGAVVGAGDRLIFDGDDLIILGSDVVAANNTYDIGNLPDGVYYPISVMNTNGDNELDPSLGDAVGLYGINFGTGDLSPDSVTITGGNRVTGVNFALVDMSAITGTVSYSGSHTGDYPVYVGVFNTSGFDPTQPPDYGTDAYWPFYPEFFFNTLDDGLADGSYYVAAYLDVNYNMQYDPGSDPAGAYGGVITPQAVNIQNGSDAIGLTIAMSDPVSPSGTAASVTWPAPAKRAPWVKKVSEALRRASSTAAKR